MKPTVSNRRLFDLGDPPGLTERFRLMRFAHATRDEMRALVSRTAFEADWGEFSSSWKNLHRDTYMADGGRYRRRRHGVFTMDGAGMFKRTAHQSHYQSQEFNGLNGGIHRWFEPLEPFVANRSILHGVLAAGRDVFRMRLRGEGEWRVEVHQMRITARGDTLGKPTPEGLHRDGVDFVLIMLIAKRGAYGGVTTISDLGEHTLARFTLTDPLETLFLDDSVLKHGVSPIWAVTEDPQPSYRDVLVVTWKRLED